MKANSYVILSRAVEHGIDYGYRRAHKHVDAPSEQALCDAIAQAVMSAVCEVFTFDDELAADDEVARLRAELRQVKAELKAATARQGDLCDGCGSPVAECKKPRWHCSGCGWVFTGPHREECPSCLRLGYWSGSIPAGAPAWDGVCRAGWTSTGTAPPAKPSTQTHAINEMGECATW